MSPNKMSLDKKSPDTKTVGLHFDGLMENNASLNGCCMHTMNPN